MNLKTTLYLSIAVLVALVGLFFARSSGNAPVAPGGPKPLFSAKPMGVTRFELAAWGKPAMVFEKAADKWRILDPIKAPADAAAVEGEINRILDLSIERSYAVGGKDAPSDDITRLQQPAWLAKLTDKDGATHTVRIGGPVLMARQTFVQLDGANHGIEVVKGDLATEIQGGLDHFRDPRVAPFAPNDAVRITLDGVTHMTLVKSKGQWTVESPVKSRADAREITQVLNTLSNARVDKWVEDSPASLRQYGLVKPRLRIEVNTEHEEKATPPPGSQPTSQPAVKVEKASYVVQFGGAASDEKVFARLVEKDKPWVFTLPKHVYESLVSGAEKFRDKKVVVADANRATQIRIDGPAGAITLEKKDGVWRITQPALTALGGQDRAEFAAVDDIMKAAGGLTATAFEDPGESVVSDYGFDRGATRVALRVEGELQPVELTLGGATRGGTGVYVRNDRDNAVFVVKPESVVALRATPLAFVDRKLLSFDRYQVNRIDLDAEGVSRTLSKHGLSWQLTAPVTAPVEPNVINDLLADAATLDARSIVGFKEDLAKFGLDHPAVRCRLTIQPPSPPRSPSTSSAPSSVPASAPALPPPIVHNLIATRHDGKAYVYVEGGTRIAEVDDKVFRDLTAEPHEHKIVKLDMSKLNGVELTYPGRSMVFEKKGSDWLLEGEPGFRGDEAKITQIANALRDLVTDRYTAYSSAELPRYKLDAPAVRVVLRVEGAANTELLISSEGPPNDEAKRRYATLAGSGKVFLIAGSDAAKFEKKLKDLERAS